MTQTQVVLFSYLSGVFVSYFLIAWINDVNEEDEHEIPIFPIVFSWAFPILAIIVFGIIWLKEFKPTLKRREK
jgi:cell shape-determining protein MreC